MYNNKHTYQARTIIKYLHKYRSKLHHFTLYHTIDEHNMNYDKL